jgi:uncharacterized Tic20 family protein
MNKLAAFTMALFTIVGVLCVGVGVGVASALAQLIEGIAFFGAGLCFIWISYVVSHAGQEEFQD